MFPCLASFNCVTLLFAHVQGSVLGPEEFFEGLGIGLRSFFGAGVVGK